MPDRKPKPVRDKSRTHVRLHEPELFAKLKQGAKTCGLGTLSLAALVRTALQQWADERNK